MAPSAAYALEEETRLELATFLGMDLVANGARMRTLALPPMSLVANCCFRTDFSGDSFIDVSPCAEGWALGYEVLKTLLFSSIEFAITRTSFSGLPSLPSIPRSR